MNIALWMLFQVDQQRVSMYHRRIQIVIQFRIAHEQSERTIFAVQFSRHLFHILKC